MVRKRSMVFRIICLDGGLLYLDVAHGKFGEQNHDFSKKNLHNFQALFKSVHSELAKRIGPKLTVTRNSVSNLNKHNFLILCISKLN